MPARQRHRAATIGMMPAAAVPCTRPACPSAAPRESGCCAVAALLPPAWQQVHGFGAEPDAGWIQGEHGQPAQAWPRCWGLGWCITHPAHAMSAKHRPPRSPLRSPPPQKPIVVTGSQLPLALPRSDARQNLLDSLCCATAAFSPPHVHLQEVALCFGGRLMRGNRSQKTNSSAYQVGGGARGGRHPPTAAAPPTAPWRAVCAALQAFDSPNYPYLAQMGVDVSWNSRALLNVSISLGRRAPGSLRRSHEMPARDLTASCLCPPASPALPPPQVDTVYRPRFNLDPRVIRVRGPTQPASLGRTPSQHVTHRRAACAPSLAGARPGHHTVSTAGSTPAPAAGAHHPRQRPACHVWRRGGAGGEGHGAGGLWRG